jgi:hypothetical protein
MSILDKINRLKQGLASEANPDLIQSTKAIIQGMTFFYLGINQKNAKLRYDKYCKSCKHNVADPVESMHEDDKQIPELSGRMCDHCGGCVLSFKLRQDIKKCDYWDGE